MTDFPLYSIIEVHDNYTHEFTCRTAYVWGSMNDDFQQPDTVCASVMWLNRMYGDEPGFRIEVERVA